MNSARLADWVKAKEKKAAKEAAGDGAAEEGGEEGEEEGGEGDWERATEESLAQALADAKEAMNHSKSYLIGECEFFFFFVSLVSCRNICLASFLSGW